MLMLVRATIEEGDSCTIHTYAETLHTHICLALSLSLVQNNQIT